MTLEALSDATPVGHCAFCGNSLAVEEEGWKDIAPERRSFGGGTWWVHGWCAIKVDEEAKQCTPDEHDWPAELDGSVCNRCAQPYDTWTLEDV